MGSLYTKRWSQGFTRSFVLGFFLLVLVLVMSLFLVSSGLRCVDRDGCLHEHCVEMYKSDKGFLEQYTNLIKDSMKGNAKCRVKI
jgi:hypothetical protein